jgi:hypothetical protein
MSLPTSSQSQLSAWRVILISTLSSAWDSVFLGLVFGLIFSTAGPETGEPSGWRFGLILAACSIVGGGLAGLGIWRACRRPPQGQVENGRE